MHYGDTAPGDNEMTGKKKNPAEPLARGISLSCLAGNQAAKGFSFEHPMLNQVAPGRRNGLK